MRNFIPTATLALAALLTPVQSLYFYIDGTNPKCFWEELPTATLVVGHYSAEEFSIDRNEYVKNDALSIFISVDVSSIYISPFTRDLFHTCLFFHGFKC